MTIIPLYLGLGTNLGDRKRNLLTALDRLDTEFGRHWTKLSDFIETEPWGFESEDRFLNAVVRYDIELPSNYSTLPVDADNPVDNQNDRYFAIRESAYLILEICKRIEREMGRDEVPEYDTAGCRIYHSRIIDIDILLFGDFRLNDPNLTIPHPQLSFRPFVMGPLSQIAPEITVKSFI